MDDDDAGVVSFELPAYEMVPVNGVVDLVLVRRKGSDGRVAVDYEAMDLERMVDREEVRPDPAVMRHRP